MTNPNLMDTMGDLIWALDRVVNGNLSDEEDWNCWETAAQETLDKAAKLIKEEEDRDHVHRPGHDAGTAQAQRRRRPHEGLLTWLMGNDVFLCKQDKSTGYETKTVSCVRRWPS